MGVEVSEHGIGTPPAKKADAVRVDAPAQQGDSTAGAGGTCGYLRRGEAEVRGGGGRGAEEGGDLGPGDVRPQVPRGGAERVEGVGRDRRGGSKGADARDKEADRAEERVPAPFF